MKMADRVAVFFGIKDETSFKGGRPKEAEPYFNEVDEYLQTEKGFSLADFSSYMSDVFAGQSGAGGWTGDYRLQTDYFERMTETLGQLGRSGSNYHSLASLTLSNPYGMACIRHIAECMSSLKFNMIRKYDSGRINERPTHPLLNLMEMPGVFDIPGTKRTILSIMEPVVQHLHFGGELFLLLNENPAHADGPPRTFTIMHPHDFRGFVRNQNNMVIGYKFNIKKGRSSVDITYNTKQMVMIKRYNTWDSERGLPLACGAYTPLVQMRMAAKWNTNLSKTGGRIQGYFSPKGLKPGAQLSREAVKSIEKYLDDQIRERQESNLPMVMSGAMEYLANTVTPREADFMDNDKLNGRKVCASLKVPSILVGDLDMQGMGGGSAWKGAEKLLWRGCLLPLIEDFIKEINLNVASRWGDNYELAADMTQIEALQEDLKDKYTALSIATGGKAWIVPNEARKKSGFSEEDGDEYKKLEPTPNSKLTRLDSRSDYDRNNESETPNNR